jgi:hypothetical protein
LSFIGLDDACKGLLLSVAEVLNATGLKYVIAGGWVPLLIEPNHPHLVHPGTRDVDVLMIDELAAVQKAAAALMNAAFRPSAKHEFQLLRDAQVGAREFVFNVDLMHPYEANHTPEMFSDIFDLGVDDAYDPRGSRFAKSIAFRSAAIVYEQNLFTRVAVRGVDLDGRPCVREVPLLTAPAFLLSKCESVTVPKRTRDAFDIYYILSSDSGPKHAADLLELASNFPQVNEQLAHLRDFLTHSSSIFENNVAHHARGLITGAARDTLEMLTP